MALYGNNPTATATVGANTNVITISGLDLALVTPGMTINFGARDRKVGDAWIISGVAPNGTGGGSLTAQGSIPVGYNSVPFVIDTTGYLGTDASYAAAVGLAILGVLSGLFGVATNLYSGARQLAMDKVNAAAVSRLLFSIAGRSWAAMEHRTFGFTPSGGQAASIETLAVRAFPDGTTPIDALLFDLTSGTGDLRQGTGTMTAGSTVDLSSAPAAKINIAGAATINSFGPGRNYDRRLYFTAAGSTLVHGAALDLPTGANIVVRAGDRCQATSDGAGNWRVYGYQRADGTPLSLSGAPASLSTSGAIVAGDLGRRARAYGTITRNLPLISTVFAGWATGEIENAGAGIVTISASGTDPFEGVAGSGITLFPKQRAYFYLDADGWHVGWVDREPLVASATLTAAQGVTAIDFSVPPGYPRLSLEVSGALVTTKGGILTWRTSDNGTNFKAGASDYTSQVTSSYNSTVVTALGVSSFGQLIGASFGDQSSLAVGQYQFYPGEAGATRAQRMIGSVYYLDAAPNNVLSHIGSQCSGASSGAPGRSAMLRISPTAGLVYGSFTLRGLV